MSGSEHGSVGWAIGVVASTLARGTPQRLILPIDMEEAAEVLVAAFRQAGHEHIPVASGVWDLTALRPGESLAFAHETLDWLFGALELAIEWNQEGEA